MTGRGFASRFRDLFGGGRAGDADARVLFVCMGNICRSPTAEAVFRHHAQAATLPYRIGCDSAGTHGYHTGDAPDRRAQGAAARRGYDMSGLRARRVSVEDFATFDWVLAMDQENLENLRRIQPGDGSAQLDLLTRFSERYRGRDVPDPYYGNAQGFELVLDIIEDSVEGLLARISRDLASREPPVR